MCNMLTSAWDLSVTSVSTTNKTVVSSLYSTSSILIYTLYNDKENLPLFLFFKQIIHISLNELLQAQILRN